MRARGAGDGPHCLHGGVRHIASALMFAAWCCAFPAALAQQPSRACGCEVSKSTLAKYDRQLWLNQRDKTLAVKTHLPWGAPLDPAHAAHERLLIQRDYITGYDDELRVPVWTAHRLRAADLKKKRSRLECFRNDQRLPDAVAAFCTDYDEPVFDRGHLVPNSDMTMSQQAMINTYVFSNMTPQHCAFNRGIWQVFEGVVRSWVESRGTLYIITGSIFDGDGDGARDADVHAARMQSRNKKARVAIPTHIYKILVHKAGSDAIETIAVLLPNVPVKVPAAESESYLRSHIVSIDDVERLSGLTFFRSAAKEDRDAVAAAKAHKAASLWPVSGPWPSPLDGGCD